MKYEVIDREGLGGKLILGDGTFIARRVSIDISGNVIIKNRCVICEDVLIITHKHNKNDYFNKEKTETSDLIIEDDVFIGARSIILPNVDIIGKGAIIGAGSVVTKNVKSNSIVAGNPTKIVGNKNEEDPND